MAVARAGEEAVPALPAPVALRPFLNFAKLPARALVVARRALDVDAEFRARVAEGVTQADVGRAGWLFLTRPQGWESELGALVKNADDVKEETAERRALAAAARRQAAADAAVRKADEAAASARSEAARAIEALAEERRRRQAASREADRLRQRLSGVTAELEWARADAVAATARAAEAERQLDAVRAEGQVRPAPEPRVSAEMSRMLAEAAAQAWRLAESLTEAAAADDRGGAALGAADAVPSPEVRPAVDRPHPQSGPRPPRSARRSPATLPPAVLDDSREAAEHLVRLPGVVVLVDGYNVSHAGWPGMPIAEQRRRLVDALTALVARTGSDVRVIFDGSEIREPAPVSSTARPVRVSFSPPGIEADDLILAMLAELPPSRPVLVATSDRRVQEEAGRGGANVVSSTQMLQVLR